MTKLTNRIAVRVSLRHSRREISAIGGPNRDPDRILPQLEIIDLDDSQSIECPDDRGVVSYWAGIAAAWTETIRSGGIPSRELVTNRAVIEAILARSPESVLDVGCGEGWLAREIERRGIRVTGIDAVPQLIDRARSAGDGDFRILTYEDLAAGKLNMRVDTAVCNFSLLGKETVDEFIHSCSSLMTERGALIIQTLHPLLACGDEPYKDGWRLSPWTGISADITNPSPWYFRTFATWIQLFAESGLRLIDVHEPLHPKTGRPASVIFTLEPDLAFLTDPNII